MHLLSSFAPFEFYFAFTLCIPPCRKGLAWTSDIVNVSEFVQWINLKQFVLHVIPNLIERHNNFKWRKFPQAANFWIARAVEKWDILNNSFYLCTLLFTKHEHLIHCNRRGNYYVCINSSYSICPATQWNHTRYNYLHRWVNFLKDCPNVVVLPRLQRFSYLNVLYFNVEYIFIVRLRCICSFVAWTIFLANLACIKLRVQCKTYVFCSLINIFSHIVQ